MFHGSCGTLNMMSPFMDNGKCTKRFRKPSQTDSITDIDGYPPHCRRDVDNGDLQRIVSHEWLPPATPFVAITPGQITRVAAPHTPSLRSLYSSYLLVLEVRLLPQSLPRVFEDEEKKLILKILVTFRDDLLTLLGRPLSCPQSSRIGEFSGSAINLDFDQLLILL
ncbi:helitron_like_N domain-containing protein [Trichonephila clavipes]|nr:helitron_like_N domain-containing protein [Trichonephila clavipes]